MGYRFQCCSGSTWRGELVMHNTTDNVTRWADAPIVFVVAATCPNCRAPKPIIVRSQSETDGSVSRKCICRRCSKRFVIVLEPE